MDAQRYEERWLCQYYDVALEEAANNPSGLPACTSEDLLRAQSEVEMLEGQMEGLQRAAAMAAERGIPELGEWMKAVGFAMVEGSLRRAIEYRDLVQRSLEGQAGLAGEGGGQ